MDKQFKLNIALGNDWMLTDADIAEALRRVADTLDGDSDDSPSNLTDSAEPIRDITGNTVGSWAITRRR